MTILELLDYVTHNIKKNHTIFKSMCDNYYDLIYINEELYHYDKIKDDIRILTAGSIMSMIWDNVKFEVQNENI